MYRLYVLKVILVQFLGAESLCFSVQYLSRGLWAQSRTRTINKWYDIPLKYLELITLITKISWHVRLIIVSPWCGSVVLYCGSGFSFIPPCGSGINLFFTKRILVQHFLYVVPDITFKNIGRPNIKISEFCL